VCEAACESAYRDARGVEEEEVPAADEEASTWEISGVTPTAWGATSEALRD
jgi:hypothetical protein